MKNQFKSKLFVALSVASLVSVCNAEDSFIGKWKGEFDTQIGVQKYTYEFKMEGTNLVGKAHAETSMGTNDVTLTEAKINKDAISFVEPLKFQDTEIRVDYTGKIKDDEIKLHRKVGDFAEEDLVAKRVKSDTNAPAAKP
jgi:hypothetical protein